MTANVALYSLSVLLVVLVAVRLTRKSKKPHTDSGLFTIPEGVTHVEIQMVGGGGGGGGSGEFIIEKPMDSYSYSVGSGGSAGTNPCLEIESGESEECCLEPVDVPITKKPRKKKASKKKASKKKSKKKSNKRKK